MTRIDPESDAETAQSRVIACLSDPQTHGGAAVERVDTPISRIFLAGDRAYKMRRAVRTNFLDFSTSDLRRDACLREIAVNRSAADLYLDVTAVTHGPQGLRLGGDGAAVEWVTVMRRFDRRQALDQMADADALDVATVAALGDAIATMHDTAPIAGARMADAPAARIDQIADALAAVAGAELVAHAERWRALAHDRFDAQAALYARRVARGRVRRCPRRSASRQRRSAERRAHAL